MLFIGILIRFIFSFPAAVVIYRGCAPQVYEGLKLNEARRKYEHVAPVVENAYEEGCTEGGDSGSPTGPSEFCYCRFHLCNGKSSIINSMDLYGSIILGIFIIELTCVQSILNNLLWIPNFPFSFFVHTFVNISNLCDNFFIVILSYFYYVSFFVYCWTVSLLDRNNKVCVNCCCVWFDSPRHCSPRGTKTQRPRASASLLRVTGTCF